MANIRPDARETRAKVLPGRTDAWLKAHGDGGFVSALREADERETLLKTGRKSLLPAKPELSRRELVKEGRRLVIFDLGHTGPDELIAHEHQQLVLGYTTKMQFHTWFKTVAGRVHRGWDADHKHRISTTARAARLAVARGAPPLPTDFTGAVTAAARRLGSAAGSASVRREAVRRD